MIRLRKSLQAWNTRAFDKTLTAEIEQLSSDVLRLHQCSGQGGLVDDASIRASMLASRATDRVLEVRLGIFFTERVGGCSCHDDPVVHNAYGELLVSIDRQTAAASISLLPD